MIGKFATASGYPSLEATPLARVDYSDVILSKIYEKDWLHRITTSDFMETPEYCGQVIQIMRAPEISSPRPYEKNQQLIPSTVTTTATCITVCGAEYHDLKFDAIDIRQACNRWERWEEKLHEALFESITRSQRRWVLARMMAQVSPKTTGARAGLLRNINLGEAGHPVVVTPDTIMKALADLQQALIETGRWVDNEMFIVVPPILRGILAQSKFASQDYSCRCGGIVSGMWEHQLMGFTPIESIHVPSKLDNGDMCFFIICGTKDATAYVTNIIENRVISKDANYFGSRYQLLTLWGSEVLLPDALAMGYWTFKS